MAVRRQKEATGLETETAAAREALIAKVARHIEVDTVQATEIPNFRLYRQTAPRDCSSGTYEPQLIVFLQGEKRINLSQRTYICSGSTFLLTSVDLPVTSQIVVASKEKPLYAILLRLDMAMVREILSQEDLPVRDSLPEARGMAVGLHTPELLNACSRLMDLLMTPEDIPFMSNLIQREIFYRILRGPQGQHLRAIATLGDQRQRTAKAIAWLKENYAKPLRVEDLASVAHMGVSTLHRHFRDITAMSPVQYQKQLRLHTARQKMLLNGMDAASAAFDVGYESASQFNREYRRFFGQPPMRDVKAIRENGTNAAEGQI